MSSGFSGGVPDFFTAGRRSTLLPSNANGNYKSSLASQHEFSVPGIPPDTTAQICRPDIIGKRSLNEFQQQQSFLQQQSNIGFYLRNVRQRPNHLAYPISPVDLSPISSISPEVSSAYSVSNSLNSRYRLQILQQRHLQPQNFSNRNFNHNVLSAGTRLPNLAVSDSGSGFEVVDPERNMMNHRLQELEKQLLGDEDDGETVSVVTNSEWSETIQNLIGTSQKPISPSPTSSSSSCCSTSASPPLPCPKQASIDAGVAISLGKPEVAADILTRLQQVANSRGTSEQRLTAHMVSALKSRLNPSENPPPMSELFSIEHAASTKLLYEFSPCFRLSIMAANLAILEAAAEDGCSSKLHVLDFNVAQGGQYVHLLHALAVKKQLGNHKSSPTLTITAFTDLAAAGEDQLKAVGEGLRTLASRIGVTFNFYVRNLNIAKLSRDKIEIQPGETLAANFAFKLFSLPDESVTTENLRDELLRRVKGLSPKVITVVEQELNTNTAPLLARVRETYEYYAALFDSLDATVPRENSDRVKMEEGLGRKIGNSVACEGRDRVERCEVFGKWRARLSMAGFQTRPMSQLAVESLRSKLNSETRGGAGFIVNEESGGISFGWMGRKLTVASAWRC